ncbi:hypothetical protein AVEN_197323-1 [Araneus ventricosus]|uniref:Uncharacterized protein n=1 Tax=Araneus ventricosus TaxID=182803 RepID=A0A4Y2EWJ8_ARAVE|nr:hypothetical protein AVEN_197323-1 [Araneus ventricosus]
MRVSSNKGCILSLADKNPERRDSGWGDLREKFHPQVAQSKQTSALNVWKSGEALFFIAQPESAYPKCDGEQNMRFEPFTDWYQNLMQIYNFAAKATRKTSFVLLVDASADPRCSPGSRRIIVNTPYLPICVRQTTPQPPQFLSLKDPSAYHSKTPGKQQRYLGSERLRFRDHLSDHIHTRGATRGLFWDGPRHFEPRSDDTSAGTPSSNFNRRIFGPDGFNVHQILLHGGSSLESGFESGTLRPEVEILPPGHRGPTGTLCYTGDCACGITR